MENESRIKLMMVPPQIFPTSVYAICDKLYMRYLILEVNMKVSFKHQLKIQYSRVIEALSLLCALSHTSHHEAIHEFSEYDDLKSNYISFFELLKKLPNKRFTWLEFALVSMERDHIDGLIRDIRSCSSERQLVFFLEHEIDELDASRFLSSNAEVEIYAKQWGFDDSLVELISSFPKVMDLFCEVLHVLDGHEAFNKKFDELVQAASYDELLKTFSEGTTDRHPLSFAQELMGKPFWNIADYVNYEFIPVYYISPFSMRLMDDQTMIYIQGLQKVKRNPEEHLDSILDPLKSISDATRLKILRMLYMHPMYGKEISDALNLTTPTVSHHLDALNQQGLVNVEKVKQIKYFSTNYTLLSRKLDDVTRYVKEK